MGANRNMNRDRVLTEEVVRACWHEWPENQSHPGNSGMIAARSAAATMFGYVYQFLNLERLWGALGAVEEAEVLEGLLDPGLPKGIPGINEKARTPSQRIDAAYEFLQERGETQRRRWAGPFLTLPHY